MDPNRRNPMCRKCRRGRMQHIGTGGGFKKELCDTCGYEIRRNESYKKPKKR